MSSLHGFKPIFYEVVLPPGPAGLTLNEVPGGAAGSVLVQDVERPSVVADARILPGMFVVAVNDTFMAYEKISAVTTKMKQRPCTVTFVQLPGQAPPPGAQICFWEGHVQKKGTGLLQTWTKRYFRLTPTGVEYYTSPTATTAKGIIRISDLQAIYPDGGNNYFHLEASDRTYWLFADSVGERVRWLYCIECARRGGTMINIRGTRSFGPTDADSGYTSGTQSAGTGMYPSHHQAAFSSGSYSQPATPVETPVAGPATRSRLPPPYELLEHCKLRIGGASAASSTPLDARPRLPIPESDMLAPLEYDFKVEKELLAGLDASDFDHEPEPSAA